MLKIVDVLGLDLHLMDVGLRPVPSDRIVLVFWHCTGSVLSS
jgi:hypothetical protein